MNTIDSLIQYFGSQRKLASVAHVTQPFIRWPTQASASSASSRACVSSQHPTAFFAAKNSALTLTGRSCAAPPNPKKPPDPMHHEKLTEAVTVKLSDTDKCFAVSRAHQKGMESASEYLRWLLTMDREQARQEYTLPGWRWG